MQETVFIKKTMEHTGVDLLFFNNVGLFESLHFFNKLFNSGINFVSRSLEYLLKVFICSFVDLFVRILSRLVSFREEDSVFSY